MEGKSPTFLVVHSVDGLSTIVDTARTQGYHAVGIAIVPLERL